MKLCEQAQYAEYNQAYGQGDNGQAYGPPMQTPLTPPMTPIQNQFQQQQQQPQIIPQPNGFQPIQHHPHPHQQQQQQQQQGMVDAQYVDASQRNQNATATGGHCTYMMMGGGYPQVDPAAPGTCLLF